MYLDRPAEMLDPGTGRPLFQDRAALETLLEERHLVATIVKKGNLYRAAEEEWASLSQAISYVTERSARYSTHAFSDIKLVANRSVNAAVFNEK